jgi:hypothetical protein
VNETATSLSSVYYILFSDTVQLPAIEGQLVGFKFYANDSEGFWNETTITIIGVNLLGAYLTTSKSEGGIIIPDGTNIYYSIGTDITIYAAPASYYQLYRWLKNGAYASTGNSYSFTIYSNTTIYADFRTGFSLSFQDKNLADCEDKITWTLSYSNGTVISYTEGAYTLPAALTYTLKVYYRGVLIKTQSLVSGDYYSVTVSLQMSQHQSASAGYIIFNNTLSTFSIGSESATNFTFTATGSGTFRIMIEVPSNATSLKKDGAAQGYGSVWTYNPSTKVITVISSLSTWELIFPPSTTGSNQLGWSSNMAVVRFFVYLSGLPLTKCRIQVFDLPYGYEQANLYTSNGTASANLAQGQYTWTATYQSQSKNGTFSLIGEDHSVNVEFEGKQGLNRTAVLRVGLFVIIVGAVLLVLSSSGATKKTRRR